MIHIFHHNDPDGWISAAIVLKCLDLVSDEKKLHECRYGMEIDWAGIGPDDLVYMVDFSLEPVDMIRLAGQCRKLHWIDHHLSAIDKMADKYPDYILAMDGIQMVGKAACELTWNYLFEDFPMPWAVRLIGTYDTWRKDDPDWKDALAFQCGTKVVRGIADPRSQAWAALLSRDKMFADKQTLDLLEVGRHIQSYQDECDAQICRRAAFETSLLVFPAEPNDGMQSPTRFRAIACTSPMCNSMLFDSVWDPDKHDVMLSFYWDAKGWWTVSVYTTKDDVDCSAIAQYLARTYGKGSGGGHRGAAGAQVTTINWMLEHAKSS